jgi:hypothetical protein
MTRTDGCESTDAATTNSAEMFLRFPGIPFESSVIFTSKISSLVTLAFFAVAA